MTRRESCRRLVLVWTFSAAATLAACACPRGNADREEFRDEVLAHIACLEDGWNDWLILFEAVEIVEGVFRVDAPHAIDDKPEEYLEAQVDAPRVLLGPPGKEARRFLVFNTTIRRWGYWPVYSSDLRHANGKRCVVFLAGNGKHVVDSAEGKVLSITPVSDLAPRRSQLESFLCLARLDPMQLAHLVAKPDSRVEDVLQKARAGAGDVSAVQSCCDELVAMGAEGLPGILHAMTEVLLKPRINSLLQIDGISPRPPGSDSNEPSVPVEDIFELLHLAASMSVDLGLPPYDIPGERWARIRVIALHLLARATTSSFDNALTERF